jgi:response regulator RpfG family c-di-GMP phosphodiesterase
MAAGGPRPAGFDVQPGEQAQNVAGHTFMPHACGMLHFTRPTSAPCHAIVVLASAVSFRIQHRETTRSLNAHFPGHDNCLLIIQNRRFKWLPQPVHLHSEPYPMNWKNKFLSVFGAVFKTPKFRNVFLGCLAIAILLPTYSTYHIMPLFSEQLMRNTENQAVHTARHIKSSILDHMPLITRDLMSADKTESFEEVIRDFEIRKLKIFSKDGAIIYSTQNSEIGEINQHTYFRDIVAKGGVYSKIVEKNHFSAEGKSQGADIAEVYVPIMKDATFLGALEIYYDITAEKQGLDKILTHSSRLLYSLSGLLFFFVVVMLFKASDSMIKKTLAEKKLHDVNHQLEQKVFAQNAEISITQKTSIEALATLAESYDQGTGSHLARIQEYVRLLLQQLEKSSPYAHYIRRKDHYSANIQLASILHDVGKIGVHRKILLKPGRLTKEEFDQVKTHTVVATKVLAKANDVFVNAFGKDSYLAFARDIALHHHEKWDGSGYPHGLAGNDIPLSARVVALADVYDALRSPRPYKPARSHAYSVAEICRDKGSHFDPHVVDAFLAQAEEFDAVAASFATASSAELSYERFDKSDTAAVPVP